MTMRGFVWFSLMLFGLNVVASAQEPPCGVTRVTESTRLVYSPIARAAHVAGLVIVRAEGARDGTVAHAEVWQGTPMLRQAAVDFVKGLRANDYGGSRSCLFSITFRFHEYQTRRGVNDDVISFLSEKTSTDPLHYTLTGESPAVYAIADPAGRIVHRKLFGIF